MGAALCAAIKVTRASANASPPQENGGQADERNAADQAVGGERRSLVFQRCVHWELMTFRLATPVSAVRRDEPLEVLSRIVREPLGDEDTGIIHQCVDRVEAPSRHVEAH